MMLIKNFFIFVQITFQTSIAELVFLKTNLWSLIHRGEFLQWRKLRATVLMLCLIPTCRLFIQELLVSVIFQAYELKH